jgi:hypothetical protein
VGGDHRRRAVSERQDGGRAQGAGAAADDVHREQPPARAADRFIGDLISRPLADIAADPYVAEALKPLLAQHQRNIETIRTKAKLEGNVAFFDLADQETTAFNKFISYYLFPEARYSVGVTLSSRAKISIGANPWAKVPRTHEINKICERYGGGGHPVVGAISIPRAELPRAREIAREIVAELNA